MNWNQLKNVIIVWLIILNIVLLGTLSWLERSNGYIPRETAENAVQVLKDHGVTVDIQKIPTQIDRLGNIPMKAAAWDKENFARTFLGKNFETHKEADTGTEVFEADGEIIRLNGGYLKYYSGREPEGDPSGSMWAFVERTLRQGGVSVKGAKIYKKDDHTRVYREQYAGKNFFEGKLTIVADKSGIVSIEGFWMVEAGSASQSDEVRPVTEVFAQFLQERTPSSEPVEITAITLGYSVLLGEPSVNYSEAVAIPTWRITTSDGKEYYYDARG